MLSIKNKGMFLEAILNQTNQKYVEQNLCIVSKIPTNYHLKQTQSKTDFSFAPNFNCDYIGCYQGIYFEFEAKETNLDYFNFQNIRINQIKKLDLVAQQHGISFLIIYFAKTNQFYFVEWSKLKAYATNHKKIIPQEWFTNIGAELIINSQLMLDYLPIISRLTSCTL